MTDELRRAVAYIAARAISGEQASAVYDHDAGSSFSFSGEVSPTQVNVFDESRGCHLDGTPPSLYDHGGSSFFDFTLNGSMVEGYDFSSNSFFEATMSGRDVSLYDYGHSRYFNYSI
jgi:hypothetical protein